MPSVKRFVWATMVSVAFLMPSGVTMDLLARVLGGTVEFWVVLRCEFVIDTHKRAVDGEFERVAFPTGDRPDGSPFGIQGGTFESWFTLR